MSEHLVTIGVARLAASMLAQMRAAHASRSRRPHPLRTSKRGDSRATMRPGGSPTKR